MLLEIRGEHFPGRSWHHDGRPCHNVHVGIQRGREPSDLVPGDSDHAVWTAEIRVTEREGALDFRGPAVQGRPGGRFVYLTWGDVDTHGTFTTLRRAKLMLADVEPLVDATSPDRRVIARVDLTDDCGGPRCARLQPPALLLTAG